MKKFAALFVVLIVLCIITVAGTRLAGFWPASPKGTAPSPPGPLRNTEKPSVKPNNPDHRDTSPPAPLPSPNDTDLPPVDNDIPVYNNPPPTDNNLPPADNDLPPAEQDRTIYSWWFKRNQEHKPPEFDPGQKSIVKGKGIFLGNTSEKKVYLTFDEGYENGYTPKILDTLKSNHVPAAFFVTADFVDKQPKLVQRMAVEGHIVGNHTATHRSLPELADSEIRKEIEITHYKVRELTGKDMKFMRPPMGEYNSRVLNELKELGYKAVFWSMAYRDWETDKQPGQVTAYNNVMDNVHPGAVILLHAVSKSNADALDEIIKGVKARGYSFASLKELE